MLENRSKYKLSFEMLISFSYAEQYYLSFEHFQFKHQFTIGHMRNLSTLAIFYYMSIYEGIDNKGGVYEILGVMCAKTE